MNSDAYNTLLRIIDDLEERLGDCGWYNQFDSEITRVAKLFLLIESHWSLKLGEQTQPVYNTVSKLSDDEWKRIRAIMELLADSYFSRDLKRKRIDLIRCLELRRAFDI